MTLGQKVMWLNENYIKYNVKHGISGYNVRIDIEGTSETHLNAFLTKPEKECRNIDLVVCDFYKSQLCNKGIEAVKFIESIFENNFVKI